MNRYFVIGADGTLYGPVDLAQLQGWVDQGRVMPQTMLKEELSGNQLPAQQVLDLRFNSQPPPSYAMPPGQARQMDQQGSANYQRPMGGGQDMTPVLVKAIISTLCCCLPAGIVAIVFASQAMSNAHRDPMAAEKQRQTSNTWANVSIVIGLIITIYYAVTFAEMITSGKFN